MLELLRVKLTSTSDTSFEKYVQFMFTLVCYSGRLVCFTVVPSRPSLTLNLDATSSPKQRLGLSLNLGGSSFVSARGDSIDVQLPLERQG